MREALVAGALAEHGERLTFRHELIRDALYTDLPRGVRQACAATWRVRSRLRINHGGRVVEQMLRGAPPGKRKLWGGCTRRRSGSDRAPAAAVEVRQAVRLGL